MATQVCTPWTESRSSRLTRAQIERLWSELDDPPPKGRWTHEWASKAISKNLGTRSVTPWKGSSWRSVEPSHTNDRYASEANLIARIRALLGPFSYFWTWRIGSKCPRPWSQAKKTLRNNWFLELTTRSKGFGILEIKSRNCHLECSCESVQRSSRTP